MAEMGKTHIVIMFTVGGPDVAAGDRLFESRGKWMDGHPREGETALRSYSISMGQELANPLDPGSPPHRRHDLRARGILRVTGRRSGALEPGAADLAGPRPVCGVER
jgi:hypothetical protein